MQNHIEREKLSKKPTRALVCQRTAKELFVSTPLLKHYLETGMVVERIHCFYEFTPTNKTGQFADLVIHHRKKGDVDADARPIGDNMKTSGNSTYGKYVEAKVKHRNVRYCNSIDAEKWIRKPSFLSLEQIGNTDYYEINSKKHSFLENTAIAQGAFILNMSKLILLRFHQFLRKYIGE